MEMSGTQQISARPVTSQKINSLSKGTVCPRSPY